MKERRGAFRADVLRLDARLKTKEDGWSREGFRPFSLYIVVHWFCLCGVLSFCVRNGEVHLDLVV